MSDYISKENTLKNIGLLSASVLMGNNKEVDKAIGGYNPSSFLAGLSYGLEQAMGMISSQPTLDEKEIIRKAFERVVERFESELKWTRAEQTVECTRNNGCGSPLQSKNSGKIEALKKTISIVKEECGISE